MHIIFYNVKNDDSLQRGRMDIWEILEKMYF